MVPTSIQRIEPFSDNTVTLLNEIPLAPAGISRLIAMLERAPQVLASAIHVAVASGQCTDGEAPDARVLMERIGSTGLSEIAITLLVRGYLQRALRVAEDRRYWRYTLACAVCCAEIAPAGGDQKLIAYVAGLLHDLGRLALIAAYPDRYANLLVLTNRMFEEDRPFELLAHERLLFGLDHFSTGSWLASNWKLPPWMRAITGKFDEQAAGEHRELVATVRAGTRLAHSLGFGYLQSAPRAEIKEILSQLPGAWEQWRTLDSWNHGEEHMRTKIESRLGWYEVPSGLEDD